MTYYTLGIVIGSSLASILFIYIAFLLLLLNPTLQRYALYAHKARFWWQNLDQPEQWGFMKNQVQPFRISSPPEESLYAWLITPIAIYSREQTRMLHKSSNLETDVINSAAFRLLKEDIESRLVISFHGNAGTVAQGWRTDTYRALSAGAAHRIFVLTADYRGFGNSTGSPTEIGLIDDGIALVKWALDVACIPPDRIVIVGHSLGTAVATAVVDRFIKEGGKSFAGILLVAAFSDMPTLLRTYAIGYFIPILSPLRLIPNLQSYLARCIRDSWNSTAHLENIVRRSERLNLVLVHAKDDWDIPWKHSNTLFNAAVNAASETGLSADRIDGLHLGRQGYSKTLTVRAEESGTKRIQQVILNDGGHNRLMTYAPVTKAVFEMFETCPSRESSV